MKKLAKLISLISSVLILASCASEPKVAESETTKTETKEVVKGPMGIEMEKYQEILDKSIVSVGNNYRMKKVIEKLRSGEDVYIAALGGSVTEGAGPANFRDGYAYQFFKKLTNAYTPNNGANAHFNDAGLSGTPSTLGLIRYETDIVEILGHKPDLFIIEFCVNDGGEPIYAKSHEALMRNALLSDPDMCVIELFSDAKSYKNSQPNIMPVATYYRVPQVSIQDTVEGHPAQIKEDKFFADYVHPTKEGHEIMADCLMNLFAKADAMNMAEPYEVPEKYFKEPGYTNFTRIMPNDAAVIDTGDFKDTDAKTQTLKKTNKGDFPLNWKKSRNDGAALVVEANCKAFFFTYKVQGSWESEKYGSAEVYVDGKKVATYEGGAANGWNNCETRVLFDNETADNHKIEVRMAKGSEKLGFTIVAMGYTN